MIESIKLPPEYYLRKIKNNSPFSFSRFGDGEVLCMFHGNIDRNCDGGLFTDDLIEPMKQIFRNQYDYYHCLITCSFETVFWNGTSPFIPFIEETCPDMPFYYGEIWQDLAFADRITEFIDVIAPYRPCFVGAKHLENVKYMNGMGEIDFIEVPKVNAFQKIDSIIESINDMYDNGTRMFCFSAGYSTKIIIDRLFPILGHDTFMIDCGSVFDPYCGILSRSGHVHEGFIKFQPYTKYKLL